MPKRKNIVPKRKNTHTPGNPPKNMTPGTKSGGGAEKDKHSAENDKNSAENDEIEVPKKSAETGGNRLHPS